LNSCKIRTLIVFVTVENIVEAGKNPQTDEYDIPDDLSLSQEKIVEQLKIVEEKMKQQDVQKPVSKIRKFDDDSSENKKDIKPVTLMSPKVNNTQRNKIDFKPEPSTSQSPKVVSSPRTSLSSQSNLQKKQDSKDSLQSFFKERAEVRLLFFCHFGCYKIKI
jgi:hypothetical protein